MVVLIVAYRQLNSKLGEYPNHMKNRKGCILLAAILTLISILPSLIEGKSPLDFPKDLIKFVLNLDIHYAFNGISIALYIVILSLPFLLIPWVLFFMVSKMILKKMGRKTLPIFYAVCLFFYVTFCFILFFDSGQLYTALRNVLQNLPYLGFKLTSSLLRLAVLFLGIGIVIPMYNFLKNRE